MLVAMTIFNYGLFYSKEVYQCAEKRVVLAMQTNGNTFAAFTGLRRLS